MGHFPLWERCPSFWPWSHSTAGSPISLVWHLSNRESVHKEVETGHHLMNLIKAERKSEQMSVQMISSRARTGQGIRLLQQDPGSGLPRVLEHRHERTTWHLSAQPLCSVNCLVASHWPSGWSRWLVFSKAYIWDIFNESKNWLSLNSQFLMKWAKWCKKTKFNVENSSCLDFA